MNTTARRAEMALLLGMTVAAVPFLTAPRLEAAERPNIILVFIDDMGWGDFSSFGKLRGRDRERRPPGRRGAPLRAVLR
jgi:hypothetical protein